METDPNQEFLVETSEDRKSKLSFQLFSGLVDLRLAQRKFKELENSNAILHILFLPLQMGLLRQA